MVASGSCVFLWRAGFAGDILMSTPAVRALKAQRPEVYIAYGCWKQYHPLVELNPAIDKVYYECETALSEFGYHVDFRHEKAGKFNDGKTYWGKLHAEDIAATGLIDIEKITDWLPEIWLRPEDVPERTHSEKPLVVFGHWSNNGRNWRLWPLERWEELSLRFKAKGWRRVLVGAPGEPTFDVDVNLVGRTHFRLTAGVTAIADLVVAIDAYTAHAAHAYKCVVDGPRYGPSKVVLVTGPVDPAGVVPPSAKCTVARQYDGCGLGGPCGQSFGPTVCEFGNACMQGLTVERVWTVCEQVVAL